MLVFCPFSSSSSFSHPPYSAASHAPLCSVVALSVRGLEGEEGAEQEAELSPVGSERQLEAWWHYALPPRHAVSAAVAACSVKGEGGWASDLFVFTPTLQKEE